MKIQRPLTAAVALLADLSIVAAPAHAGPLLSGYGGPGQGSQAILGATLLNAPRTPAGPGGPAVTPATGGGAATQATTPARDRSSATRERAGARGQRTSASGAYRRIGPEPSPAYPATALERDAAGALGISGMDKLYILLALGALVATWALTTRLTNVRGESTSGRTRGKQ